MTKTRVDPYSVSCDQCKAPIGFNCTYVHPRDWTPDSQRRFFNNKSKEEQIDIIARAGEYTKQPHLARFTKARKIIHEQAKIYNWAMEEPGYDQNQLPLQWNYQEIPDGQFVNSITFNGLKFWPQEYIDKVLADARAEWVASEIDRTKHVMHTVRMEGYREGHSDGLGQGIQEGLRRAVNLIATGSEDGE